MKSLNKKNGNTQAWNIRVFLSSANWLASLKDWTGHEIYKRNVAQMQHIFRQVNRSVSKSITNAACVSLLHHNLWLVKKSRERWRNVQTQEPTQSIALARRGLIWRFLGTGRILLFLSGQFHGLTSSIYSKPLCRAPHKPRFFLLFFAGVHFQGSQGLCLTLARCKALSAKEFDLRLQA